MGKFDCNEDCIHLKACRRVQKIAKAKYTGLCIPRHCDADCTCYQTLEEFLEENHDGYYTREQVQYAIERASADAQDGYTDNIVEDYL